MAKEFKGTLTLEWKNKNKSILLREENETVKESDEKTKLHRVNEDES
jgi:hypothetical protein